MRAASVSENITCQSLRYQSEPEPSWEGYFGSSAAWVKAEAKRRKIELLILLTSETIELLERAKAAKTNAVLHVTC